LDVLFKGNQPVASRAGGAVLNSSVSLGRLGLPVHIITEIGNDHVGNHILGFLKTNRVNISKSYIFDKGTTTLALAFLDDNENAEYTFYKNYPKHRLKVTFPKIKRNDLVLFGSFFSICKEVMEKLRDFLSAARKAGAIILYDPNFRKLQTTEIHQMNGYIKENIEFADIIRGSNEDFKMIFGTNSANETFQKISTYGTKLLVYTSGANHVNFRSSHLSISAKVPKINPISTVGAGDNFNAGILYSLYKLKISRDDLFSLKKQEWQAILDSGITFGTIVCESYDNYISEEFAQKLTGSR